MPLPREVEYWEKMAQTSVDGGCGLTDNVWKRPHQIRMLLKYEWIGQRVLEIGVGNGIIAGAMGIIVQRHWRYMGTELSQRFMDSGSLMFGLKTVKADVRELPYGPFSRIIAFDSLEHVRPEHRAEGYAKIASVAADGALLFIHFSRSESYHDKEFDHPFGLADIAALEIAGFTLNSYERYKCKTPICVLDYAFVVMQK